VKSDILSFEPTATGKPASAAQLRSAGYTKTNYSFSPYGTIFLALRHVLARGHRTTITWDIEPDSYAEVAASRSGIVNHVVSKVQPGSIIVLHVMYSSGVTSLASVASVIDQLQAKGYRFVTLSELLRSR